MSVRSKRTFKSQKSQKSSRTSRTTKTNQTRRTQTSIRKSLLQEIKSKHGVTNTRAWHIKESLLQRLETPNPFNKLISKHDSLPKQTQSSICCTLSTVIETIVNKKNPINHNHNDNAHENAMDTDVDESVTVSSTELFAVFMTLLENKTSESHEMSIVILLSHLIAHIPINVLLNQFDKLSRKLGEYLYVKSSTLSTTIGVEYCMHCMSALLIARISHNKENTTFWNEILCQKMLQGLFVLSTDEMGNIRKLALKHLAKIFKCYTIATLPTIIKRLMRCFIDRQIEGMLTVRSGQKIELNVIGFISELLMQTLPYLSLLESSYIITLLFNVISHCMQVYGDNTIQIKHLNLQQMFLKLIYKFIQALPQKYKTEINVDVNRNKAIASDANIDELAKELKHKIDLKQLVKRMKIDDIEPDDNDKNVSKYVKFITQLFAVIQQLKPQNTDTVGVPIYFDCMVSVIDALYVFDQTEALKRCISIITIIFDGFESNKKVIVEKTSNCLVQILQLIVNEELIADTKRKIGATEDLPTLSPQASFLSTPNDTNNRQKLPILQRITILIESLLDFKYKSSWIYVYKLCKNVFKIFAGSGFFLLCNILCELSEIRCMDEPVFLTHLEDTISAAIKYCGPQNVLNVIPLNLPTCNVLQLITLDKAILKANLWILPLLKSNVNRTNLSFFGSKLLPIADMLMKQRSEALKNNMIIAGKQFNAMSHMIWSIFPSFCIYPKDLSVIFPQIAESVAFYLINVVEVRGYIIYGFIHLIKKPLEFIRRENEKGIFGNDMISNAKLQMEIIAKYTQNFLPLLCNILVQTANEKRCNMLKCIALFSQIGDKEYIASHFKRTITKCLEDDIKLLLLRKDIMEKFSVDNGDKKKDEKLAAVKVQYESLLNQETAYLLILNEMIHGVDIDLLEQFWAFLKQQFMKTDQSPLIQKLLYKNLLTLLNYKESVLLADGIQLNNFIQFLLTLNTKTLCIGARYQRLLCIHTLFDCLAQNEIDRDTNAFVKDEDDDDVDNKMQEDVAVNNMDDMKANKLSFLNIYPGFIGELIQNAGVSNLKVRKISLEIIELIAQRLEDISGDLFNNFIYKLLAGVLSESSVMQSATILCLTYLIVQFELRISPQILSELLKTISLRIVDPANNVIKASLDFIQIVIQELPDAVLEHNLMDLVASLLSWMKADCKHKFKVKINKCMDLLLKRFGYEKILKLVPHRFERLVKYLRKRADYIRNRREKKKKLQREDKLNEKKLNKELEQLPPDHPLQPNVAQINDNEFDSDEDDGKLTVFQQLRSSRMQSKKSGKGTKLSDMQSVRMRIDGRDNITDLSSKKAVKKQLISEYEANRLMLKHKKMNEIGLDKQTKKDSHIRELADGRLLITVSSDEERGHKKKRNVKPWQDVSDGEEGDSESDLSEMDDDDRDVDDILSQYSKYNKMTQLKKALADVSRSRKSTKSARNERLSLLNSQEVISKRRKILDAVKNDDWVPGELQPYKYHMMAPSMLSRKKRHFRQSTFERVMGRKRNVTVRTDSFSTNSLKISRTRKVAHGRYTLKRSKIKAKQKHLMRDIQSKYKQNELRRARSKSRSKSKTKTKKRGTKRRLAEI